MQTLGNPDCVSLQRGEAFVKGLPSERKCYFYIAKLRMKSCFDKCTGLLERVSQKYKFIECFSQLAKSYVYIFPK